MAPTLSAHTIGVIGSGTDEHDHDARQVGELLADLVGNLLTGGGNGVMRPIVAFSITPALLRQFPGSIRRVKSIGEVEAFVRAAISSSSVNG